MRRSVPTLILACILVIAALGFTTHAAEPPALSLAPLEYITTGADNQLLVEIYSSAAARGHLTIAAAAEEDEAASAPAGSVMVYQADVDLMAGANGLTAILPGSAFASFAPGSDITLTATADTPGGEIVEEEDYTVSSKPVAAQGTHWTIGLPSDPVVISSTAPTTLNMAAFSPLEEARNGHVILRFKRHKGGRVLCHFRVPVTIKPGSNTYEITVPSAKAAKAKKLGAIFVKALLRSEGNLHARVKALVDFDLAATFDAAASGSQAEEARSYAFTAHPAGGVPPYSCSWDFGDGTPGSGETASHSYASPGSYTVILSVTDSINGTVTAQNTIAIAPPMSVAASASPTCGPPPLAVTFSAQANNGTPPYTYAWNLGDGSTNAGASFTHTYSSLGTYSPSVTATDSTGMTTLSTLNITAGQCGSGGVTTTCAVEPSTGTAPLAVSFSAQGSGGTSPYTYAWDFGDGQHYQGSGSAVTHTFNATGTYHPTLVTSDATGTTASCTPSPVQVSAVSQLRTSATATPDGGLAPLTVSFTGSASGGTAPYAFSWNFGDGGTATGQTATHTYTQPGTYTVTFSVTDTSTPPQTATASATVIVSVSGLSAAIQAQPSSGPVPLLVNFSGIAGGGQPPYTYAWTFGDGGTSTAQAPPHTYATVGIYTVGLTVTDSESTPATAVASATIAAQATGLSVTANASPTSGRAPLPVSFTCNASGGIPPYSYVWNFGDGGTSSARNPTYTYTAKGSYSITVTVTDSEANPASTTITVPVTVAVDYPLLTATAAANPTSGRAPLPVSFTGSAAGGLAPYNFSWTFGDGGTSLLQNPTHTYNSQGDYFVHLTVTDSEPSPQSVTVTFGTGVITVNYPLLTATATANPTSGPAPLPVSFTGAASGGLAPYSYSWTFGDGGTSALQNPSHTYNAKGNYTVQLTVSDSEISPQSVTVTLATGVIAVSYPVLTATASASPLAGMAPLAVTFTGGAAGGLPPYSWAWTFGNGGTAATQNPVYTYTSAGTFTATLTVTDSQGTPATATASVTGSVVVYPPLLATAFATPSSGNAPLAVTFSGSATGGLAPYSYAWTFGDVEAGSGANVNHTYTSPGNYTATLKVTDSETPARSATTTVPITVLAYTLTVTATASPTTGVTPLAVAFQAAPSGGVGPYTYAWTFGDGGSSTLQNPNHTYTTSATYTATVTLTDNQGWTASATVVIQALCPNLHLGPISGGGTVVPSCSATYYTAQFSETAIYCGSGSYTWAWSDDRGNTSSSPQAVFNYLVGGVYTAHITLRLTDNIISGSVATQTTTLTMNGCSN